MTTGKTVKEKLTTIFLIIALLIMVAGLIYVYVDIVRNGS